MVMFGNVDEYFANDITSKHRACEAGHGKLKADQWKSFIEFDLPVSPAQMCLSRDTSQQVDENVKRRQKLAESTMLLATASQWATSHVTSNTHVEQFTKCMHAYLDILLELDS